MQLKPTPSSLLPQMSFSYMVIYDDYGSLWCDFKHYKILRSLAKTHAVLATETQTTKPNTAHIYCRNLSQKQLVQNVSTITLFFPVNPELMSSPIITYWGWQFPTKKLFRGRRNRRKNWFIPMEFRLFRGTQKSRNSVPNPLPIPRRRKMLGIPYRATKLKQNSRKFVPNHSEEDKITGNFVP